MCVNTIKQQQDRREDAVEIGENNNPFGTSDFSTFGHLVFLAKSFSCTSLCLSGQRMTLAAGFYFTDNVFQCLCKCLRFPRFYRATLTHKTLLFPCNSNRHRVFTLGWVLVLLWTGVCKRRSFLRSWVVHIFNMLQLPSVSFSCFSVAGNIGLKFQFGFLKFFRKSIWQS